MKNLVLLPLKFVAMMAVLLSLCAGFQVVVDYTLMSRALQDHFSAMVFGIVFSNLKLWFFPMLGLSTLLLLSGILHQKKLHLWQLMTLFVLLTAAGFGAFYINTLPALTPPPHKAYDFNIPEKTIFPFEKGFFYVFHDRGERVQGLLYHANDLYGRFELLPDAVKNPEARQLLIGDQGVSIPIKEIIKVRADPFDLPLILRAPVALLERSSFEIQKTIQPGLLFAAILSASLAFSLTGLWFFVRLTRWPLFNVMLGLIALFGLLLLANVTGNQVVTNLFSFMPVQFRIYILPMTYVLCGLFMFGWTLFLPSLRETKPGTTV